MKYYFSDTNKYLSIKLILSILFLITLISCKKTNNDILNPSPNIPPTVIDSNKLISQISEEIILNLNDAFRLKFVTNRVRGEFSVINPSAWEGSFTINFNVNKRANPTIAYNDVSQNTNFSPSALNTNIIINADHIGTQSFALSAGGSVTPPTSGTYWYGTIPWTASIEL
jgi:hypothetical protein